MRPIEEILRKCLAAESDLRTEWALMRRTWESNPTLDALNNGASALRELVAWAEETKAEMVDLRELSARTVNEQIEAELDARERGYEEGVKAATKDG